MRLTRYQRGDTMVEVIIAFSVFTLIAVGTITIMNRGLASAERSLEITLVREQIDSQAELIRYAQATDAPAWQQIKAGLVANAGDSCYGASGPTGRAFFMNVDGSKAVQRVDATGASYSRAQLSSTVTLGATPRSYGLWVYALPAEGGGVAAYDMHIRTCWDDPGTSSLPMELGTIVRIYDAA